MPALWFGFCLVVLAGATVWLGLDLHRFLATRETSAKALVRLLYSLFTATDTPVLPLVSGSLITGVTCLRRKKADPRLPENTVVSEDSAVANDV